MGRGPEFAARLRVAPTDQDRSDGDTLRRKASRIQQRSNFLRRVPRYFHRKSRRRSNHVSDGSLEFFGVFAKAPFAQEACNRTALTSAEIAECVRSFWAVDGGDVI